MDEPSWLGALAQLGRRVVAQVGGHVGVDARRADGVEERVARPADDGDALDPTVGVAREPHALGGRRQRGGDGGRERAQRRRLRQRPDAAGAGRAGPRRRARARRTPAPRTGARRASRRRPTSAADAGRPSRRAPRRRATPPRPTRSVGDAASDGVNVPSPVDVHAHRVYSPIAPAPAAASASTRRSASATGTNTTCLSSGLGRVRGPAAPCRRARAPRPGRR